MRLAVISVALLLPFSAAQAQMSSITDPGTPPPPQQSAAPARKQRLRDMPSNKTVQELYDACIARHQSKGRGGRNLGENCRKMAQARGK